MSAGEIAYKQRFSVDLSTTDKWETLASSKHTLQIIARAGNYIDSDKSVPIEFIRVAKLATLQNVTENGTTVSWDEVENATSYEIFANGVSIGEVSI